MEPLDLGLPISNLDGLRVVLDIAENTPGKGKEHTYTRIVAVDNKCNLLFLFRCIYVDPLLTKYSKYKILSKKLAHVLLSFLHLYLLSSSRQTESSSFQEPRPCLDKQKSIDNSKISSSSYFPIFLLLWNVP